MDFAVWSSLQIVDLPVREYILIHPANEALRDLKGCIAPVSVITGAGKGIRSSPASCGMETLISLVYGYLNRHEQVS